MVAAHCADHHHKSYSTKKPQSGTAHSGTPLNTCPNTAHKKHSLHTQIEINDEHKIIIYPQFSFDFSSHCQNCTITSKVDPIQRTDLNDKTSSEKNKDGSNTTSSSGPTNNSTIGFSKPTGQKTNVEILYSLSGIGAFLVAILALAVAFKTISPCKKCEACYNLHRCFKGMGRPSAI